MQHAPTIFRGVRPQEARGAARRHGRAFTLVELLIVIGILVLLMAVAVPIFRALTGDRSLEQGTNMLSSLLAQARNQALANKAPRGLCFYYSQDAGRYVAEIVYYEDPVAAPDQINVLPGGDTFPLPPGIGVSAAYTPPPNAVRVMHVPTGSVALGANICGAGADVVTNYPPVVMFDENGQFVTRPYLVAASVNPNDLGYKIGGAIATAQDSQSLIELFDAEAFSNVRTPQYLHDNAIPLIVNRYNGTLIKGE